MPDAQHSKLLGDLFAIYPKSEEFVIALAGNPNVGKSTIFNSLTGLKQHTGNWPGKTVDNAQGRFVFKNENFLLVDLPGTYSILTHSMEEEVARDFLCFGRPDVTIIVLDATCLERNLNLVLQVMEITPNVVVCINLMDEARKKNIRINFSSLEKDLGVSVVPTTARQGIGLVLLKENIFQVAKGLTTPAPVKVNYSKEIEEAVNHLLPKIEQLGIGRVFDPRWVALRLLDGDNRLLEKIAFYLTSSPGSDFLAKAEGIAL